jgi:hypothetical protein
MAVLAELRRLLSRMGEQAGSNSSEDFFELEALVGRDSAGHAVRFLERELPKLAVPVRRGAANVVAGRHLENGDLKKLQELFATGDADVKASVLDALCGEPRANRALVGPGIVALAVQGLRHPAWAVRMAACSTVMNQCDWKVDVSGAVGPLGPALRDRSNTVRMQAAYTVGHLARRRYDVAQHLPALRRNVTHKDKFVRESSAWALYLLSRHKHDIGAAVPDLVQSLTDDEAWEGPRKNAAAALLHHARKSPANAGQVRECVAGVRLDRGRKEINTFLQQLARVK